MKIKEYISSKKAKKIRRKLLIFVDQEMKKKKKDKHYILINSKNPLQLENYFLLNQGPINTPTTYFINIAEKHLVERVYDKNKKINYFYSDNLGHNYGMLTLKKRPNNFLIKYSSIDLKMDIGMLLNNEESNKDTYNNYVYLYSLLLTKKNIFEYKMINNKPIIRSENNISFEKKEFIKIKNQEKNIKSTYSNYLINFCYTKLKKRLLKRGSEKANNIRLIKEKYNKEKIFNDNRYTKKIKKSLNSKPKKIIKEIRDDDNIKLIKYESPKNSHLINKLKHMLDKNKLKLTTKRLESGIKINHKYNKFKTNYYQAKENEFLRIPIKKEKKKYNTIKKCNTRKSITNFKSINDFSSPEKMNKMKIISKNQKKL